MNLLFRSIDGRIMKVELNGETYTIKIKAGFVTLGVNAVRQYRNKALESEVNHRGMANFAIDSLESLSGFDIDNEQLDDQIKDDIYNLLLSVKRELSLTLLVGTSNLSAAVFLSDLIYLMDKNPGRIVDSIESAP